MCSLAREMLIHLVLRACVHHETHLGEGAEHGVGAETLGVAHIASLACPGYEGLNIRDDGGDRHLGSGEKDF